MNVVASTPICVGGPACTAVGEDSRVRLERELEVCQTKSQPYEIPNGICDPAAVRAELARKTGEWSTAISLAESLRAELAETKTNFGLAAGQVGRISLRSGSGAPVLRRWPIALAPICLNSDVLQISHWKREAEMARQELDTLKSKERSTTREPTTPSTSAHWGLMSRGCPVDPRRRPACLRDRCSPYTHSPTPLLPHTTTHAYSQLQSGIYNSKVPRISGSYTIYTPHIHHTAIMNNTLRLASSSVYLSPSTSRGARGHLLGIVEAPGSGSSIGTAPALRWALRV